MVDSQVTSRNVARLLLRLKTAPKSKLAKRAKQLNSRTALYTFIQSYLLTHRKLNKLVNISGYSVGFLVDRLMKT